MKGIVRGSVLAGFALAASLQPVSAQPLPSYVAAVDSIFAAQKRTNGPGCAVGISRDGRVELARGYGLADLESGALIGPVTIFNIGSTSKQFVTYAIQLLVDEGKLRLDDDVRRYIPELPDLGGPIRVSHLVHHTSGLRDYASLLSMIGWRGGDQFDEARALALVAGQRRLNFEPGTRFLYSNTGYLLLATIVTRVSGQPWETFAAERIFAPLGMTRSSVRGNPFEIVKGRALGYSPSAGGMWRLDQPNHAIVGSTAVMTTVEDLARWTGNYWNPTVGSRGTVDRMRQRAVLSAGDTVSYASGITVERYRGVDLLQHGGATGGYRAQLLQFPDDRVGIAVLCNGANANPDGLARQVADRVISRLGPVPAPPQGRELPADQVAGLAGTYRDPSNDGLVRLTVSGGGLVMQGGGSGAVRTLGADRLLAGNSEIRVERGPRGGPTGLVMADGGARYARQAAPVSDPARLARYVGAFRSAELDRTWWVELRGSELWLVQRSVAPIQLEPAFEHGYRAAGTTVRFVMSRAGRATALLASNGRANLVEFGRVSQ
ncbi:MAG: serine hydrolase domain-containing protein [Gemmatimonadales bacterium]